MNLFILIIDIISTVFLVCGIGLFIYLLRKKENPVYLGCGVMLLVAFSLMLPRYSYAGFGDIIKAILVAVHDALQFFTLDSNFADIRELVNNSYSFEMVWYSGIASISYIVAPLLLYGAIFMLIKDFFASLQIKLSKNKEVYIFSILNKESLACAKTLKEHLVAANKLKESKIFFCDFDAEKLDGSSVEDAKAEKFILLHKDITSYNYPVYKKTKMFFMDTNEEDNLKKAIEMAKRFKNQPEGKVNLYLVNQSKTAELIVNASEIGKVKVRRIDSTRMLVYSDLFKKAKILQNPNPTVKKEDIFSTATLAEDGIKDISVVLIGFGSLSKEEFKALTWLGQMQGYRLTINVFDANPNAYEEAKILFPELLSDKCNNLNHGTEDANFSIKFHTPKSFNPNFELTPEFKKEFEEIKPAPTFVYVACGEGLKDLEIAIRIREWTTQMGRHPYIESIVYEAFNDTNVKALMNFKNQEYDIALYGNIKDRFDYNYLIESELIENGKARALDYVKSNRGDKSDEVFQKEVDVEINRFYTFEYNYYSNIASALHRLYRKTLNLSGANKPIEERTEEEKDALRRNEHQRWNTYMRTEGYQYNPVRNDLAKFHHLLIDFKDLPEAEKAKDDM